MTRDYAPEGQQSVAAYLLVADATAAIAFLERVFDAQLIRRLTGGKGGVHAEVLIDDTVIMLGEPPMATRAQPAEIHVYVPDCYATYGRALEAGASADTEPSAQPYGDRRGSFIDPSGHRWWVATHDGTAGPD